MPIDEAVETLQCSLARSNAVFPSTYFLSQTGCAPTLRSKAALEDANQQASGWLINCGFEANYPHVKPVPAGGRALRWGLPMRS